LLIGHYWVDEASLALNIVNRTFSELTIPLDYNQGAPIGFLFIEKFIILILGNKDYILRLFPIISGMLSVYLIYLIAKKFRKIRHVCRFTVFDFRFR